MNLFFTRLLAICIPFFRKCLFALCLHIIWCFVLIFDQAWWCSEALHKWSDFGEQTWDSCTQSKCKKSFELFFWFLLFAFFLLSFVTALYIWGISLLPVVWIMNIFYLVLYFLQCWNFLGWCRPIYLFLICCLCHYSWIIEDITEASAWRMFSSVIYGPKSDNKFHNPFWISLSVTAT